MSGESVDENNPENRCGNRWLRSPWYGSDDFPVRFHLKLETTDPNRRVWCHHDCCMVSHPGRWTGGIRPVMAFATCRPLRGCISLRFGPALLFVRFVRLCSSGI